MSLESSGQEVIPSLALPLDGGGNKCYPLPPCGGAERIASGEGEGVDRHEDGTHARQQHLQAA